MERWVATLLPPGATSWPTCARLNGSEVDTATGPGCLPYLHFSSAGCGCGGGVGG